jgi:hypothetical protein
MSFELIIPRNGQLTALHLPTYSSRVTNFEKISKNFRVPFSMSSTLLSLLSSDIPACHPIRWCSIDFGIHEVRRKTAMQRATVQCSNPPAPFHYSRILHSLSQWKPTDFAITSAVSVLKGTMGADLDTARTSSTCSVVCCNLVKHLGRDIIHVHCRRARACRGRGYRSCSCSTHRA